MTTTNLKDLTTDELLTALQNLMPGNPQTLSAVDLTQHINLWTEIKRRLDEKDPNFQLTGACIRECITAFVDGVATGFDCPVASHGTYKGGAYNNHWLNECCDQGVNLGQLLGLTVKMKRAFRGNKRNRIPTLETIAEERGQAALPTRLSKKEVNGLPLTIIVNDNELAIKPYVDSVEVVFTNTDGQIRTTFDNCSRDTIVTDDDGFDGAYIELYEDLSDKARKLRAEEDEEST